MGIMPHNTKGLPKNKVSIPIGEWNFLLKFGKLYAKRYKQMGKSLGKMIRHYRRLSGITQEKLGELCGVTSSCVSRWENDNLDRKSVV